jgi:predicted DNA repair protein MutK
MAGSLLLLLDDIATVLDDVAAMTKVAAKKTAGVLGDDLALNAKQVAGVRPARELPVVWRVARGSAVNKLLLVPAALAISWAAPWAIAPLLVIGGAFICYEGAEKILHRLLHGRDDGHGEAVARSVVTGGDDPLVVERERIAGAIRTDFILSAEIIVITLGVVAGKPLATQLGVLTAISVAMTIGVYGLVAGIVKLDDFGALLAAGTNRTARTVGRGILAAAPWLMRGLSVAGTAAMFLVGGGIIAHAVPALQAALHDVAAAEWLSAATFVADAAVGLVVGLLLVAAKAVLPAAA